MLTSFAELVRPPSVAQNAADVASTLAAEALQELEDERAIEEAWRVGELSWLLHDDQLRVYNKYREWEKREPAKELGVFARIFVLDIGKRWGKTTLRLLIRFEDCIRNPGFIYRYSSAFAKNIEEIVEDVSRTVLETCPNHLRPAYKLASQGRAQGFYFPNGSILKLVGLDKDPDGLRGRASDGDDVSEAAFVRHLRYSIKNVLYHQYQGRPHARMCLESSAPIETDSQYDKVFVEDAKVRDAYAFATIDDNPRLSDEEREEFIRAAGGRDDPECQREYFNQRTRNPELSVIPEFKTERHVKAFELPKYAHCYVSADPGMRDLFALLWAFWDAKRNKLCIQRDFAVRGAGTSDAATVIKFVERELWLGGLSDSDAPAVERMLREFGIDLNIGPAPRLTYWNGRAFVSNPYLRVSDVDLRLIRDLSVDHGIGFKPTAKDDKDAALFALRNAFRGDLIEIHPRCTKLIAHLNAAKWNTQRTDYERHETHGHYDLVDALVYLWRNLYRNLDPYPLELPEGGADAVFVPPELKRKSTNVIRSLNKAFGGGPRQRVRMRR